MREGGPPCSGFIDVSAGRAASSFRRIAPSPGWGRATTRGAQRMLDDLALGRPVELVEAHAIRPAAVEHLVAPHDLGDGLDVVGGLVDVELDRDAIAHLARRRRDDARAVGSEVDRPGAEPAAAAGRAAPREDIYRDAHGRAALRGPAILGKPPPHD